MPVGPTAKMAVLQLQVRPQRPVNSSSRASNCCRDQMMSLSRVLRPIILKAQIMEGSIEVGGIAQPASPSRLSLVQEIGLALVVILLGAILSVYGWHDAAPGKPNTFLNFDNLIDGIATPMSYYAIMAVGLTIVIITGGIDISVGSIMALSALGGAAALQTLPENSSAIIVLPIAMLVPLVIGLICGAINGALIVSLSLHPLS
jgi:predicted ABC-type sugar transport system permease subunit